MLTIPVEQIAGDFYGGYPFKVSWSYGGESEPSKLTVELVNENGNYGPPDLSLVSTTTISIGGFTFNGYLVGYTINSTADQKTLTLEYVDRSIILDRYWVGLNYLHGNSSSEAANVILVGKEYHPCDVNMDSSVDYTESEARLIDPCDPCPFSPVDKYKEVCDPRTKDIENFDIFYTFSELLPKAISKTGLTCEFDASALYMLKAQHVGNLRSVLSSWCSDLGLSFFWDPVQDKLIFKARGGFPEGAPSYQALVDNPNATEVNFSENILGTFSQGFIGRYERPGSFNNYKCQNDTWKMLRPITLEDLFLPEAPPAATKYSGELSPRSIAVALSYYSSTLRDAFLWFIYYGITNASQAEVYKDSDDEPSPDDGNDNNNEDESPTPSDTSSTGRQRTQIQAQNKGGGGGSGNIRGNSYQASMSSFDAGVFSFNTNDDCGSVSDISSEGSPQGSPSVLSHYGNMKIRAVYHRNGSGKSKSNFILCRDNMPKEVQAIYQGTEGSLKDPHYYFFVAECSEEAYDASVSSDNNLANSFLGRYYFNKFRTIITGASDDETECEIQGPSEDGNGRWHKAKEGVKNLEIFRYGHDEGSFLSSLKISMSDDIQENINNEESRLQTSGLTRNPEDFVANSFILYSRNAPKWSPEREFADKWYGDLYAWCGQQIPHKYANGDGRPDILYILFPEAKWNENIKLFMVREKRDGLDINISKQSHQSEITGGNKIRIEEDEFGSQFRINEGQWGLLSTDCYVIDFDGVMPIYTPPGSFGAELNDYQDECATAPSYSLLSEELYVPITTSYTGPGYRIFASCSSEFPKVTAKFRFTTKIDAPNANEVRKVDYVDYQLSEDNIAIFGDSCTPDREKVNEYLTDVGSTSEYSYNGKLFDVSFKLAGAAPEVYTVEQGMSAMNIEISENGMFTTYNLSTRIIPPPSVSYMEQNLRFNKRAAFGSKLGLMSTARATTIRH
jgi:hypothetical protein